MNLARRVTDKFDNTAGNLLYDSATLQRVRTALALTPGLRRTPTDEQRAYALETLDLLLTKAVSKQLLILMDGNCSGHPLLASP